jgi:fatty-acyl-CoA synthase
VERVLREHPAVAEAAVIGIADPKWQEVPVACIVRRGASPGRDASASAAAMSVSGAEIERFCLEQLARYKVPRRYVFVDSLPRNALGNVQHFRLKQLIGEQQMGTPSS